MKVFIFGLFRKAPVGRRGARAGAAAILLLAAAVAAAQDSAADAAFFGGTEDSLVADVPEAAASVDGEAPLPAFEKVRIGGSLSLEATGTVDADSLFQGEWFGAPGGELDLAGVFYLDARPSDEVRVFAKTRMEYPFTEAGDFELRELFADVTLAEGFYLRTGKQTVNWGVGRYFSPANVINLERIDPENPDEELAGPVAARLHAPLGTSNYYAYAILEDMETDGTVGLAAKGEWVVSGTEFSLAGVWRPERPWAVAGTASGALFGLDLYCEAVYSGGGEKTYVVEDGSAPLGVSAQTRVLDAAFSATAGLTWTWSDETGNWNLAASGQYFWNGAGYADPGLFTTYPAGVAGLVAAGDIGPGDLYLRGRQYGAAGLSLSDIARSDAGLSLFWLGNLDDGSGRATVSASYSGFKNLTIAVSYGQTYGLVGSEYGMTGARRTIGFSVSTSDLAF